MERKELVLAALAPAQGKAHSPVQVQKLFFLIDRNIPDRIGGPKFDFQPYDYGPFDIQVYEELEAPAAEGSVEISPASGWNTYRLTPKGQELGEECLVSLPIEVSNYIREISGFVRRLSFSQLVGVIYKKYPEMRVNSVFQG